MGSASRHKPGLTLHRSQSHISHQMQPKQQQATDGKLAKFFTGLAVILLSSFVISAFLSHWSLLDGAPRNSLRMFMDGNAHRPFAYRVLGPIVTNGMDSALPAAAQSFLADEVAPKFRTRYVEPLIAQYEQRLPGVTNRADRDWRDPEYRRTYVLMTMVIFASFAGAMVFMRRSAILVGADRTTANAVMLLYAAITPTMFLNGGYFYDFIEQLGACALVWCVLSRRWIVAFVALLLMQANKETALLMVLFLAPLGWHQERWQFVYKAAVAMVSCLIVFLLIRWQCASLAGQSTEWHLTENMVFWARQASWLATEDFYSVDGYLPRMSFLLFALASIAYGWYRGASSILVCATLAFCVLAALLLTMGFQDEFRNLSLSLPLLALIWAERGSDVSWS